MDAHAPDDGAPVLVRVTRPAEIPAALDAAGVPRARPVLVVVGGAAGMDEAVQEVLAGVLREVVVPAVERHGAVVVDGGTDSGAMRLLGRARAAHTGGFPLVGVAVEATVRIPGGGPVIDGAAQPERHHDHLVLVPGTSWGDESPWLAAIADAIAGDRPSLTLVVNGGEITYADVAASLERECPVVVLAGTGRTADTIADAVADTSAGRPPGAAVPDERAVAIAASPRTQVVAVDDAAALGAAIDALLGSAR